MRIPLRLPTIARILKAQTVPKGNKRLEWALTPGQRVAAMPNQPNHDKAMLSIRIPRELKRACEIKAKTQKMSLTEWVAWTLSRETQDVELSPDDYRKIADAVEASRQSHLRSVHRPQSGGGGQAQEVGQTQ